MFTQLSDYKIMNTIGSGSSGVVKLAKKAGETYAAKIVQLESPSIANQLKTEVKIQRQLVHPNIIKVVDYKECTVQRDQNSEEECRMGVIISELAPRGQMFDYIKQGGGLGEQMTRFYAHQLIVAIHHIHQEGFAHRDIKLENILLDKHFNIKVTDFGISAPIEGSNGSGFETRKFAGSAGYMAPEILQRIPFNGQVADLFALAVVLFTMMTGVPPFKSATLEDPHYRLLCLGRTEEFWAAHAHGRTRGFFSVAFKDLISQMLAPSPYMRPALAEVVYHPWFLSCDAASPKEVKTEMRLRSSSSKAKTFTTTNSSSSTTTSSSSSSSSSSSGSPAQKPSS